MALPGTSHDAVGGKKKKENVREIQLFFLYKKAVFISKSDQSWSNKYHSPCLKAYK